MLIELTNWIESAKKELVEKFVKKYHNKNDDKTSRWLVL